MLLIYTQRESVSLEVQALAEMEVAALEVATADTQEIVQIFSVAGHRIENLGSSITLSVGILSALREMLASRKF